MLCGERWCRGPFTWETAFPAVFRPACTVVSSTRATSKALPKEYGIVVDEGSGSYHYAWSGERDGTKNRKTLDRIPEVVHNNSKERSREGSGNANHLEPTILRPTFKACLHFLSLMSYRKS